MKTPIAYIILLIIGVGVYLYYEDALFPPLENETPQEETGTALRESPSEAEEVCVHVITPAMNPNTNEIQEFPTPCDVPDGWELILPEGLDVTLQVL